MTSPTVLLYANSGSAGAELAACIARLGHGAQLVTSAPSVLEALNSWSPQALVIDLEHSTSLSLVEHVLREWSDLGIVVIQTSSHAQVVTQAITLGVVDVLTRPFGDEELGRALSKATATTTALTDAPPSSVDSDLLGDSSAMRNVRELVRRAASSNATVLLRGESGTGKELVARRLHRESPRRAGPFVKVLSGAFPETLLESELFGYERGAFTGALTRKPGRVELAQGGTLFLDEIGDVSPGIQLKLLRLLQDREYERLGGREVLKADVRFVAATHRNLDEMVKARSFRDDLFYRLKVVTIWLPPLRARRDDVAPLARSFCRAFGQKNGKPAASLSEDALAKLRSQRWPGNVRELQNFVENLVVLSDGPEITEQDVDRELSPEKTSFSTQPTGPAANPHETSVAPHSEPAPPSSASEPMPLSEELRLTERRALLRALRHTNGNRTLAARVLGVARATLYKKLSEHGIE